MIPKDFQDRTVEAVQQVLSEPDREPIVVIEAPKGEAIHGIPRLILPLSGDFRGRYYLDGHIQDFVVTPQNVLFCCADGYMYAATGKGDTMSFSYYGDHMRVTRTNCGEPVLVHHTASHGATAVTQLVEALDNLAKVDRTHAAIRPMIRALLWLTHDHLAIDTSGNERSSMWTWKRIDNYVREHATEPLTRSEVARRFRLSEHYISHLYATYSGKTFNEVQLHCRIEEAAALLCHSNLTIEEIATRCGFTS